jgi:hypothetical protein
MKKPPSNSTSRRTSRSASSRAPGREITSSQAGDDSELRPRTDRDDIGHTTPQSTSDTSLSLSAPEFLSQAASGPPSESFGFGGLDSSSDYSAFLLSPGGPLATDQDPSLRFTLFFEPQGELRHQLQLSAEPSQEFITPRPVGADSAANKTTSPALGISSGASPASQTAPESAGRVGDYSALSEMSLRTSIKRKADSDPSLVTTTGASGPSFSKRRSFTSTTSAAGTAESSGLSTMRIRQPSVQAVASPADILTPSLEQQQQQQQQIPRESEQPTRQAAEPSSISKKPETPSAATSRKIAEISARLSPILPAGKVFPIRIGSELFQLSGASISSDGKNYECLERIWLEPSC